MANPINSVLQPLSSTASNLNPRANTPNSGVEVIANITKYTNSEHDFFQPMKEYINNKDILEKLTPATPKSIYTTASNNTTKNILVLNSISNSIAFLENQIASIPTEDKDTLESLSTMLFSKINDLVLEAQKNHADISPEIEEKINTICNHAQCLLNFLMDRYSEINDFPSYVNCMKHLNKILMLKHEPTAIMDRISSSSFIDQITKATSDTTSNQDEHKISLLNNLNELRNLFITAKLQQQADTNPINLNTFSKIYNPETTTIPSLDIATIQYSRLTGQINSATNLMLACRKQILGTETNNYKNYKIPSGSFNLDIELIKLLFTLGNIELTQILYSDISKNNLQQDIIPLEDLTQEITKDLTNIIDNLSTCNEEYEDLDEITEVDMALSLLQYHPKNMLSYASLYPDTQTNKHITYNALSYLYTFIKHASHNSNWKDKLQLFNLLAEKYVPDLFPNIDSFTLSYEDANRIRFANRYYPNTDTNILDKYKYKLQEFYNLNEDILDYIDSIVD
jgi:hypothetical protein